MHFVNDLTLFIHHWYDLFYGILMDYRSCYGFDLYHIQPLVCQIGVMRQLIQRESVSPEGRAQRHGAGAGACARRS